MRANDKNELVFDYPSQLSGSIKGVSTLKWRFLVFDSIYKYSTKDGYHFPFVLLVLDFFASLFPTIYFIIGFCGENPYSENPSQEIFPQSLLLSYVTPHIFSTNFILFVSCLFMILSVTVFITTFLCPKYLKSLHSLLNIYFHFIILPFLVGCFSYSFYYVSFSFSNKEDSKLILSILVVVFFCPYALLVTLLFFIETNTVLRPTILFSEWFDGNSYFYPVYFILNCFLLYLLPRISLFYKYSSLLFCSVTSFVVVGLLLKRLPMMLFLSNEYIIGKIALSGSNHILSIIFLFNNKIVSVWELALIPALGMVSFLFIHWLCEKKRNSMKQFLDQIDTKSNDLNEVELSTIFSSINNEFDFRLVIKSGLSTGSTAVMSKNFVYFVLKKYPNSNWMVSYVGFLYGVIWGMDKDSYQFFLHLLSLDVFSFSSELIIFEILFSYMQTALVTSPIMIREINKFREINQLFANKHKQFWESDLSSDTNGFFTVLFDLYSYLKTGKDMVKTLNILFPYAPAVAYEHSIFYADFKHNFQKASYFFNLGNLLSQEGNRFVSTSLFSSFGFYYHLNKEDMDLSKMSSENDFLFLSLCDQPSAKKHPSTISIKDEYLNRLSSVFITSKNQKIPETPFIRDILVISRFLLFITIIFVFLGVIVSFFIRQSTLNYRDSYMAVIDVLNESRVFRKDLITLLYDMSLVKRFIEHDYNYHDFIKTDVNISVFSEYLIKHIDFVDKSLIDFFYLSQHFEYVNINHITCDNMNFSDLFPIIHTISESLIGKLAGNDIISIDQLMTSYNQTRRILDHISFLFSHRLLLLLNEVSVSLFDKSYTSILFFLVIESLLYSFLFVFLKHSFRAVSRNIFNVYLTLQKPLRLLFSSQFDRLLSINPTSSMEIRLNKFPKSFVYIFICFVFVNLPLFRVIYYISVSNRIPTIPEIEPYPMNDYVIDTYDYFGHALIEYTLTSNLSNIKDIFDLSKEEVESMSFICIHKYFYENRTIHFENVKFLSLLNSSWSIFLSTLFVLFGLCALMGFFYSVNDMIHFYKSIRSILFYIPNRISRSNPVFSKLVLGKIVNLEETENFAKNVSQIPDDFTHFCSLIIDSSNNIVSFIGNPEKYFGCIINSVDMLKENLLGMCTSPKREILHFFDVKEIGKPIFVSYGNEREYLISFESESMIVIKDESFNHKNMAQQRLLDHVQSMKEHLPPVKPAQIPESICMIILGLDNDGAENVFTFVKNTPEMYFIDSRYNQIVIGGAISAFPLFYQFISPFQKQHPKSQSIISYGGTLIIYDQPKNIIDKPRCIGKSFTIASELINHPFIGKTLIMKEIFALSQMDTHGFTSITLTEWEPLVFFFENSLNVHTK